MARNAKRRQFGSVDHLPSGRWRARYVDADGLPTKAPHTFATKADAQLYLAKVQADRDRGTEYDPRKGNRTLADFAAEWIDNGGSRGKLGTRTASGYRDLMARQIVPVLGAKRLASIQPEDVRTWRTGLLKAQQAKAAQPTKRGGKRQMTGDARTRQAYALLKAVMNTAVADGLIPRNPCQIKGAGIAQAPERQLLSLDQFAALVEAHPAHLRPALHLAMGAHLRIGELVGLQRRDLDLTAGTLTIERQIAQDGREPEPTKTGSRRVVDLPSVTVEAMREYLTTVPKALPGAPLFVRPGGAPLTRAAVDRAWEKARTAVGVEWAHFHDLRHAGLTLSAQSGATIPELMQRAGQTTSRAAMIYQHAAVERGRIIAAGLDAALRGEARAQ